ncbi:MAG: hypothetical protein AAFZ65_19025, partial [Planctomycetota bacterium]
QRRVVLIALLEESDEDDPSLVLLRAQARVNSGANRRGARRAIGKLFLEGLDLFKGLWNDRAKYDGQISIAELARSYGIGLIHTGEVIRREAAIEVFGVAIERADPNRSDRDLDELLLSLAERIPDRSVQDAPKGQDPAGGGPGTPGDSGSATDSTAADPPTAAEPGSGNASPSDTKAAEAAATRQR